MISDIRISDIPLVVLIRMEQGKEQKSISTALNMNWCGMLISWSTNLKSRNTQVRT